MSDKSPSIADRIAAVSPTPKPKTEGRPLGLTCHRFYIPFDVQTPEQSKLHPGQVQIKVLAQVAHVECQREKCGLWNGEKKECEEILAQRAISKIPEILEGIDGYMRMHNQEG